MAWGSPGYFPVGYQPYTYQQPQMMTPPTIRAEIVQVEDETAVDRFPMAAGVPQMFMTRDEKQIIVKTMFANGKYNKDYYDKRAPKPEDPTVDFKQFVTREEFETRIAQLNASQEESHEPV